MTLITEVSNGALDLQIPVILDGTFFLPTRTIVEKQQTVLAKCQVCPGEKKPNEAIIAAISHPYFKLRWIPEEKCNEVRELFINKIFEFQNRSYVNQKNIGPTHAESKIQKSKTDDFFALPSNSTLDNQTLENSIRMQCHQYLNDRNENLEMLHQFPEIRDIFIKYNTVLPSSGPVERLFNYAGMILSPKRRSLSDDLFQKILLLKLNENFI